MNPSVVHPASPWVSLGSPLSPGEGCPEDSGLSQPSQVYTFKYPARGLGDTV